MAMITMETAVRYPPLPNSTTENGNDDEEGQIIPAIGCPFGLPMFRIR
jgi:hypothetical protein